MNKMVTERDVKKPERWSSSCGVAETNLTCIHEDADLIPGLTQWVRICELWCRSQMWLGSQVAVVVVEVGSCSSDLTPSLGTSICCQCGPKKTHTHKVFPKGMLLLLFSCDTISGLLNSNLHEK